MSIGTPFMPDLEDAVLFLEGVHSNIIQWNAMLEQYNQINSPKSMWKIEIYEFKLKMKG